MANRIPSVALSGAALEDFANKLFATAHQEHLPEQLPSPTMPVNPGFVIAVVDILAHMSGIASRYHEQGEPLTFSALRTEIAERIQDTLKEDAARYDEPLKRATAIAKGLYEECLPPPMRDTGEDITRN